MESDTDKRLSLLERFADAWNRQDIDELMACMSDDCAFYASAGEAPQGTQFTGRAAVRRGYEALYETFPHGDAVWSNARHFVTGDRGVSEWEFSGTRKDGVVVRVHGCDIFRFDGDRIAVKDSYRKAC